MRTDSVVRTEGMKILRDNLGRVDAERFVSLILREPFDYSVWRTDLHDENISLRDLSSQAMAEFEV